MMNQGKSRSGRWPRVICLAIALGMMTWGTWFVISGRRFQSGLAEARRLMDADRFPEARRLLIGLPSQWSNDPEFAYRLGVCSHAGGDIGAAMAAWARVEPRSDWGSRAGLARARTLVGDLGRFSDAEVILEGLLDQAGPARDEVRHTLAELYFWEGRRDEVSRLIERAWRTAADPVIELRDHWRAESAPTLVEQIRSEVERAGRSAPDDDRVWLARASLAVQAGRMDEAASWLERCSGRRPEDPSVWQARLARARTVGDLGEVRRALTHLPADRFTEGQRLALRAWIASRRSDFASERRALEQLIAIEPGETQAFDRLASLAWESGEHDRAQDYRRRKAVLDAAKDRYRLLLDGTIIPSQFAELGGLAESLGRRVEAEGWWTLRARFAPSDRSARDALSRLQSRPGAEPPPRGLTLAQQLADIDPELRANADQTEPSRPSSTNRAPRFVDRAESAGLRFIFENGRSPQRQIPETTAGGVGLLDYDGDGWLDVYVVQGGVFPPDPGRPSTGDRLFRNRRDGTFEDVTASSGIAGLVRGYGHGVTVGDFDNDGHPDLFLTRWRSYALYRNRGDSTFEDFTDRAGLGGDRDWPTSAAFADLDNDGDLDLYVCHYLVWDEKHPALCKRTTVAAPSERVEPGQEYNYCIPRPFPALPDHLFRNDGGRFVDVTADAGIIDSNGRGLGVVAADLDEDGWVDLFVANDTTANYLWHNQGGMKLEELGVTAGVACNAAGAYQAGMGTAVGDLDGDGRPDLLVTNFYGESTTFFRNMGGGMFGDETVPIGLAGPTRFLLGFGIAPLDANNDGRLDLAIANGHVNDDRPDYPYAMPALLLTGDKDGRLTATASSSDDPWAVPRVARGLAVGDLDNDGRVDVLLVAQKSPLAYLRNQTTGGHALTLLLEGTASNRDAVGAVVTVTAGGRRRRGWRYGGGSYQSASDPRIHFGLDEDRVEQVEVRWPSGRVDRFGRLEADRGYRLREGDRTPSPLAGFGHRPESDNPGPG
jgi:enediyne biosynthesis protein E4